MRQTWPLERFAHWLYRKNGKGGFSVEPAEFQLNSVVMNRAVLSGFATLRRTLLKPLRNLALLLFFFGVIKFLSPLRLPISPPGQCAAKARIMAKVFALFDTCAWLGWPLSVIAHAHRIV